MLVTQGLVPHVAESNGTLTAAVHEGAALLWVELSCRDDFRQLLHIGWFDIHNV